ncbi:MAG: tRNA-dihydrouridine synthase [Gemmatimonadota bacterium]
MAPTASLGVPAPVATTGHASPPSSPAADGEGFAIGPHRLTPLRPGMPVLALAPMAGVANWAFRLICASLGARLVGVEFVNCRIVEHQSGRIDRLLDYSDAEIYAANGTSVLAAQIYGNDAELIASGARELQRRGAHIVDINFGCSVPQIVRKGSCAAYLKDLDRLYDAVRATVEAVSVPVTVKTRIGWDDEHINIVEVVRRAQDAGAQAIAIHARTVVQKYEGQARWEWIARACEAATVPVFGNGDVRSYADALAMRDTTGCDGGHDRPRRHRQPLDLLRPRRRLPGRAHRPGRRAVAPHDPVPRRAHRGAGDPQAPGPLLPDPGPRLGPAPAAADHPFSRRADRLPGGVARPPGTGPPGRPEPEPVRGRLAGLGGDRLK